MQPNILSTSLGNIQPAAFIARRHFLHKYQPLSIIRYSYTKQIELETRGVKDLAKGSKHDDEDSKSESRNHESILRIVNCKN